MALDSWTSEHTLLFLTVLIIHGNVVIFLIGSCHAIEEERKTLKSTLDVDLNLSQHLMSTSQVNISCQHLMSIFQLDFPFLMPSISQYLEFNIYDCYFWVGFPISAVKYFSKLKFCIYDWTFGVDFPFPLLSISQNWNSEFMIELLGWISHLRC